MHFNTSQQRSAKLHSSWTCTDTRADSRFVLCLIRKKGKKILQQLKRQAHGLLKANKESALVLESVHSELSGLPLSLTKEVSGEEEEPESRDMEEAEGELGTATLYSGGRGNAGTQHTVKTKTSDAAGKNVNHLLIIVYHLFFSLPRDSCWLSAHSQHCGGRLPGAPEAWCLCGCEFSCLQERKGAQEPFRSHANGMPGLLSHRRGKITKGKRTVFIHLSWCLILQQFPLLNYSFKYSAFFSWLFTLNKHSTKVPCRNKSVTHGLHQYSAFKREIFFKRFGYKSFL